LSESTRPKVDQIVANELIKHKIKDLIDMESGVVYMFHNDRLDELQLIYELSEKVDTEKTELRNALQERIFHSGNEINRAALTPPTTEGSIANQQTAAAIRWVEDVLALKDKYDRIVDKAFQSDQKLHAAQTQSFTKFVNYVSFGRASENVSLFIDENMKKGIKDKSEAEIETVLQKAIDLLKYISDKDMFERYYKKHLSRRLLMNKSQKMDVEKQMIGKMKLELGNTFTTKMEVMFKDMSVSADLTSQFKIHRSTIRSDEEDAKKKPVDLGIQVLTSMTWPQEFLTNATNGGQQARPKIIYPEDVERAMTSFDRFYSKKHNGRRLTWLPSMGTADVRATFPGTTKSRTHELNVSTYAMIVLHLFNDLPVGESLSCNEIQASTNIPMSELIRNLQSLAVAPKTRILRKEPMSKDVKEDDRFYFNENFKSQFLRIKVGVVASNNRVESERERLDTEKKNDETRNFVCEAAIVRIMK
jgi:cullin 3